MNDDYASQRASKLNVISLLKCINQPLSVTWQNNLIVANACFHVLGFCWFFTVPEAGAYLVCGKELSDLIMKANVVT